MKQNNEKKLTRKNNEGYAIRHRGVKECCWYKENSDIGSTTGR